VTTVAAASPKILVVEDEPSVREVVRAYLERDGYRVEVAADGREALELAARVRPALVVLDLMLPDVAGEDVCRELRARSDVPILIVTAKASEEERLHGLALGADDYLTKPFSPRELVARVRAILRRAGPAQVPLVDVLSFDGGALEIDTVMHEVRRDGERVELTPTEYRLLVMLARYPGRVYSRAQLLEYDEGADERTVDAHVKNLRRKLEPDPRQPRYVETVLGVGYRLAKR
jgi:DNA-binding response OmpR family regulator